MEKKNNKPNKERKAPRRAAAGPARPGFPRLLRGSGCSGAAQGLSLLKVLAYELVETFLARLGGLCRRNRGFFSCEPGRWRGLAMRAWLKSSEGCFQLKPHTTTIGRHEGSDVVLQVGARKPAVL